MALLLPESMAAGQGPVLMPQTSVAGANEEPSNDLSGALVAGFKLAPGAGHDYSTPPLARLRELATELGREYTGANDSDSDVDDVECDSQPPTSLFMQSLITVCLVAFLSNFVIPFVLYNSFQLYISTDRYSYRPQFPSAFAFVVVGAAPWTLILFGRRLARFTIWCFTGWRLFFNVYPVLVCFAGGVLGIMIKLVLLSKQYLATGVWDSKRVFISQFHQKFIETMVDGEVSEYMLGLTTVASRGLRFDFENARYGIPYLLVVGAVYFLLLYIFQRCRAMVKRSRDLARAKWSAMRASKSSGRGTSASVVAGQRRRPVRK